MGRREIEPARPFFLLRVFSILKEEGKRRFFEVRGNASNGPQPATVVIISHITYHISLVLVQVYTITLARCLWFTLFTFANSPTKGDPGLHNYESPCLLFKGPSPPWLIKHTNEGIIGNVTSLTPSSLIPQCKERAFCLSTHPISARGHRAGIG